SISAEAGQRARLRDAVRAAASVGGVLRHVCRPALGAVGLTAMDDMSSITLGGKRRVNFRATLATQILERNLGANFRSTGPHLVRVGDDPAHSYVGIGVQAALKNRNHPSELGIVLGVTRIRQYAPQRLWFFRPFLAEPITDGGVRRFGMFALVCSYV